MGIRVAVDALGGDRAPLEIVSGALDAATTDIQPVLYGPAGLDTAGLEHVVTDGIVAMHDKPAEAVRGKPDASLVRAVRAAGSAQRTPSCPRATPARCWPRGCSTYAACRGPSGPASPS